MQSWGAHLFGHAHPEIVEAATLAAQLGTSFGAPTELEVELAERIVEALPSVEQVRLVNSGTEAAMSAIRLARGATGRDKIVKFEGCYHGHSDSLLGEGRRKRARDARHPGVGRRHRGRGDATRSSCRTTISRPCAAAFAEWGREIAVVVVEPVAANMGVVAPEPGFLEGLRELCTDARLAAALRRGHHRLPSRVRRRADRISA